ncbi:uncharacterized protein LOC122320513 [Drosophila ficusphila]|uniref:uncharacterized protein LOC122320513 n=1 Tax=Drosophila ficusphila TaxID=30025 RepID=UPI001C897A6C|nr:uncharacterized protein LOC122320513 [Drosophila ficusphila]
MPDSNPDLTAQIRDLQQQLEALRTSVPCNRDETTHTRTRTTIHLPKFAHSNPQLWFAQVERSFRLHHIVDDTDKFDLVTLHLEADVVLAVEDLVIRPPDENKYVAIKNRLLQKYSESPESKLRRLLQGGDTSGLKPSEILANMRRLAPDPGSENIILTLFLAEMPASIRPTLTVWEETDLDKLAKIADKMLEAVNHNATFAISTNTSTAADSSICAVSTEDPWKKVNEQLRSLSQKFDDLQKDVKRLQFQGRSRSPSRNRPQTGNANYQSSESQEKLCYYHERFGENAHKCRPPCSRSSSLN